MIKSLINISGTGIYGIVETDLIDVYLANIQEAAF